MNGTTIFFDFETGGTEPHHPNIQLAAIAVRDWKEVDCFEQKIAFDMTNCDSEALRINGYTLKNWKNAKPEQDVASAFVSFLQGNADLSLISQRTGNPYMVARLAGHNILTFDIPRLRKMLDSRGFWPGCWWYPLDTYQRAIWHFTEQGLPMPKNFQLQTLASHFGIGSQGTAHEALADVRLCALVAEKLCTAPASKKTPHAA